MKKKYKFHDAPTLCISIAKKPGKFGMTVHNAGYNALGLNFIYIPFSVNDINNTINGIRSLNIRGCSVSMPFKEKIIPLLDKLDPIAKRANAVNTIVNDKNCLIGYNTDVISVKKCLQPLNINKNKKIIILGSGGIAKAILVALKMLRFKNIIISNRTQKKGKKIAKENNIKFIKWSERNCFDANVIINATSIGMYPNYNQIPISEKSIKNSEIIMDVVASPINTKLIQLSKKYKIISVNGFELALYQACEQFKLYTGKNPPVDIMKKAGIKLMMEK